MYLTRNNKALALGHNYTAGAIITEMPHSAIYLTV